jgi:hypothetical protein
MLLCIVSAIAVAALVGCGLASWAIYTILSRGGATPAVAELMLEPEDGSDKEPHEIGSAARDVAPDLPTPPGPPPRRRVS